MGALAAVSFGYDLGIIGAAILFTSGGYGLLMVWQQGAVVGAAVFGAMAGGAQQWVGSPIGWAWQWMLCAAGVVFTVGALGAGVASTAPMLVSFRFVSGLAVGIASALLLFDLARHGPGARSRCDPRPGTSTWSPRGQLRLRPSVTCWVSLAPGAGCCCSGRFQLWVGGWHADPAPHSPDPSIRRGISRAGMRGAGPACAATPPWLETGSSPISPSWNASSTMHAPALAYPRPGCADCYC